MKGRQPLTSCNPVCWAKTRERRGSAGEHTVSSKFGFLWTGCNFLLFYFGLLRELAAGPHSQRRATEKWGVL